MQKQYDHQFFGVTYSPDPPRLLVRDRNRLSALRDLHLAKEEDFTELEKLHADFQAAVTTVVNRTGEEPATAARDIDSALLLGVAQSLHEATEILIEGPIITGFEGTQDPSLSNKQVLDFLKAAFGETTLRKARLGRVTKDDLYMIYRNTEKDEHVNQGNELLNRGLARWEHGQLASETREAYMEAAKYLEGVDDIAKLRHLYKVRASAGFSGGYGTIDLHSFGIEQPQDFDYLANLPLSDEDKTRVYILGTLSHEVAHRYQKQLAEEALTQYGQIITEETDPSRPKYVSDYVHRHQEVYGSSGDTLLGEDLAESVRIYTTNPDFLKEHYPRRFAFIEQNMTFVKAGSVIEAVKDRSST